MVFLCICFALCLRVQTKKPRLGPYIGLALSRPRPDCTEVVPYTNSRLLNTSVWINCYFSLLTLQPFLQKTREPLLCKSAKTLTAKQAQPPYGNETDYITKHLKSRSPSPKNLESLEFLPHGPFWLTVQLVLF